MLFFIELRGAPEAIKALCRTKQLTQQHLHCLLMARHLSQRQWSI
jgi:hypothetical protein